MTVESRIGDEPTGRPILGQILVYIGFSFIAGGLGAGALLGSEEGFSLRLLIVVAIVSGIGAVALYAGVRVGNFDPPSLSNRAGRSQLVLIASCLLGALTSIYLMATDGYGRIIAGEFIPTAMEAGVALGFLFLVLLPIGLFWQRNIDEHEDEAVKSAAYYAFGCYVYIYLGWLIASSVQWVPPVHDFGLFMALIFIFLGIWVVKRAG